VESDEGFLGFPAATVRRNFLKALPLAFCQTSLFKALDPNFSKIPSGKPRDAVGSLTATTPKISKRLPQVAFYRSSPLNPVTSEPG
jgi:hypothetical protein